MKQNQRGFTLIEVVAVIGILAILSGMLIPLANRTLLTEKYTRVRGELQDIQKALDFYFYDKLAYPASLENDTFLGPYLSARRTNESLTDDLNPDPSEYYGYGVSVDLSSVPITAHVWSVGADGVDDSSLNTPPDTYQMADDDIYIISLAQMPATQRTRLRLDIIGAALCKYYWDPAYATPNTMTAVADWSSTSTTRAALLLLAEFNYDGFGRGFKNTAPPASGSAYDTPVIYSKGYDGADDSGGDDDICF